VPVEEPDRSADGRAASERLIFDGDVSTGAADDLQRATEIAIEMVTKYGMDEKVGQRTYASRPQTFLQVG
jgi:cell division protease FtsH